mgnify:CR=1 FL=1
MEGIEKIIQLKKEGKVIGFTCSTFELGPHSGHDVMLSEARSNCDYLVVGLQTDPTISRPNKNKPIQTTLERWIQVQSNKYVDMIIPYDTEEDLLNLLQIIEPDIRFIGEEYKDKEFTGKELGIKLYYNKRRHNYSSSGLRERIKGK